tara:strand:- start:66 stop:296 length:231 start_codon:yes stop_codon:yes gene_type:complete
MSVSGLKTPFDVPMRVVGSALVITAYFIVLHVSVPVGVVLHFVADLISVPYFIRTKSWDVVIMLTFLLMISLSKLL